MTCVGHHDVFPERRSLPVGVVEAGASLGRQGPDLLPVGDQLVLLQVDLGRVLGVGLLQALRLAAQHVHLVGPANRDLLELLPCVSRLGNTKGRVDTYIVGHHPIITGLLVWKPLSHQWGE